MAYKIIDAKTAAVDAIYVANTEYSPISFIATGLQSGEVVDIQVYNPNTDDWEDLYIAGQQVQLKHDNMQESVYSPIKLRFSKGVTTGTVNVVASARDDI